MATFNPIVFAESELLPIQIPVTLGKQNYMLCEASEDAARKYRNFFGRAAKINESGKVTSIDGIGDIQALLVSLCLFSVNDNGALIPVSENTIRGWLARTVKKLFDTAKEISNLDEKGPLVFDPSKETIDQFTERAKKATPEDASKNSHSPMTTASI